MGDVRRAARECSDQNFRDIYRMIEGKLSNVQYTQDGVPLHAIAHSSHEISEMKRLQFNTVKSNYVRDFGAYTTLSELESSVKQDYSVMTKQMTKDGFYSPLIGTGTGKDPTMMATASQPLLLGPEENTAVYANGGIAAVIIDKKSKGVQLNGYTFKSGLFKAQELKDLQDYADSLGLATCISESLRDGNLYGGSVAFPVLAGDNPLTMGMTAPQLVSAGLLNKNCVAYFANVDRWNTVIIPNYDLTAQDYMLPRTLYVPISGFELHTDRCALVRPKPQPYWSAIRNLGWGTSDLTSYMRSLIGYEIIALCIPIMVQQLSLLVHQLPLDGIIAQNGVKAAKQWQKENEAQLRNWSILNPKAINSFGEINAINRTYTGFDHLIDTVRKDVSSKAGIPESVIFFTQASGIFNKTEEDIMLKQSETIRLIQRQVAPTYSKLLPFIAASLWGLPNGYDSWTRYQTLQISFDTPVVSSPSQKAEIGFKYAQTIKTLVDSGMSTTQALSFATKIIGEVQLPSDFEEVIEQVPAVQPEVVEAETTNGEGLEQPPIQGASDAA